MMAASRPKSALPIGIAHFSSIMLPPAEFAKIAGRAGFSRIGLRLHPAFPGAPYYELPVGSAAAGELKSVLAGEEVEVFDIEFFVIDPSFDASSVEATLAAAANVGARRLSVCGDDPDHARLLSNFSDFCVLAERYGLAVDIENMGWRVVKAFEDSIDLVTGARMENAGVLVDGIHFFRNGALGRLAGQPRQSETCSTMRCSRPSADKAGGNDRGGKKRPTASGRGGAAAEGFGCCGRHRRFHLGGGAAGRIHRAGDPP